MASNDERGARASGLVSPLEMRIVGGWLVLDFANTKEGRDTPAEADYLATYEDLVDWATRVETVADGEGSRLRQRANAQPAEAETALARARTFRAVIFRIFSAVAQDEPPSRDDLYKLQGVFIGASEGGRLVRKNGHFTWTWEPDGEGSVVLDRMLWPISHSAVDLLRSGRLDRLKQCPGGGDGPCRWLFLDDTKAGNRKWCSSTGCGAVAKWRRQNRRRYELRAGRAGR